MFETSNMIRDQYQHNKYIAEITNPLNIDNRYNITFTMIQRLYILLLCNYDLSHLFNSLSDPFSGTDSKYIHGEVCIVARDISIACFSIFSCFWMMYIYM